ncbi:hypothetical protein HMPREF6485_2853 [Segatella buccae ATCC 33574]|uniref:Uncharacterized protein n=1 Tax=Segatella buccae ATCC 33574 TaxID=873513 RepID=E6KB66_9BACT|nr:hypothetical protein HMPREF6485_2853 [Segatella buccae ATCC 33574]
MPRTIRQIVIECNGRFSERKIARFLLWFRQCLTPDTGHSTAQAVFANNVKIEK